MPLTVKVAAEPDASRNCADPLIGSSVGLINTTRSVKPLPSAQCGTMTVSVDKDDKEVTGKSPSAFSILSEKPSTVTFSETVIPAARSAGAFRTYVENNAGASLSGGVVVANPAGTSFYPYQATDCTRWAIS